MAKTGDEASRAAVMNRAVRFMGCFLSVSAAHGPLRFETDKPWAFAEAYRGGLRGG
ncbi:hypothetical protein D3C78_1601220 [compost metagenome]